MTYHVLAKSPVGVVGFIIKVDEKLGNTLDDDFKGVFLGFLDQLESVKRLFKLESVGDQSTWVNLP